MRRHSTPATGRRPHPLWRAVGVLITAALWLASTRVCADDDRSLFWRALDVTAHLDGDGRLHVRERHVLVFTGAWNGGERLFRVEPGQQLEVERLARVDAVTGDEVPMRLGHLDDVDGWQWTSSKQLRWRSRLATDPAFDHAERTYLIDYVLSGVVREQADGYRLRHDCAFPDRTALIERFSCTLTHADAWQPTTAAPTRLERRMLVAGQGVVLDVSMKYLGGSAPRALAARPSLSSRLTPNDWRRWLVVVFAGFVLLRLIVFLVDERRRGRWTPLVPVAEIDQPWLEQHLLRYPPEVLGALLDRDPCATDVAAMIARMTLEGKLQSQASAGTMHLSLQCERKALQGGERALVSALFFDGDTTDTQRVREHYRSEGFNPARILTPAIRAGATALLGEKRSGRRRSSGLPLFVVACVWMLMGWMLSSAGDSDYARPVRVIAFVLLALPWLFAVRSACAYRLGFEGRTRALIISLLDVFACGSSSSSSGGGGGGGW